MSLSDLIPPGAILPSLRAHTKKQTLQEMADRAAELSGVSNRLILEAVREREKLGATGVGGGIAIPHAKLPGISKTFAVFARLERAVEFDARDGVGVDIICMLIAPEHSGADHLKALSRVARVLHDPALIARLRSAKDAATIHYLLAGNCDSRAA